MEHEKIIQPISQNIEIEERKSFSNVQAQEVAKSVYPADSRSMIHVEDAIREQTEEVRRIREKLSWVILLLALPYVISFTLMILAFAVGKSVTDNLRNSFQNNSTYYQK